MKILDRLPISNRPHVLSVGQDVVQVHRNQIIVWLSVNNSGKPMPAILDTGHGHNFSISKSHLDRWSGATLERIGELAIDRIRVVQYAAEVRIHRNVRGKTELTGESYPLEMPHGISVFDEESLAAPRLPLIGLRAIIASRLKLVIDGDRQEVTMTTKWF